MSKVTPFTSKAQIEEQASLWISRIDRGLSEREQDELQDWLKTSDSHKECLFELAALWDDLSVLHELQGLFPLAEEQQVAPQQPRYMQWTLAACVAMASLLSVVWLSWQPEVVSTQGQIAAIKEARTQVGQQKRIELPDGSVVNLNTDSQIQVDYTAKARTIRLLQGEAHFDVAHNPSRPFVVVAGDQQVVAVGTAFNVQVFDEQRIELLVTEGKVRVAEESEPVLSEPTLSEEPQRLFASGEKATFAAGNAIREETLTDNQIQRDLAWQQGMLVFEGESLDVALAEVARYTQKRFVLADPSLKQQRVAGYFKANDIDGLLQTLAHNFNIQSEHGEQDQIILSLN